MYHVAAEAILAGLGYLMQTTVRDIKAELKEQRADLAHVKETYFKRADFTEFKNELWNRLDRFEQDVKDQLNGKH